MPNLPRSTPEAQGLASAAISAFLSAADRDLEAMHSFMLLRHGHVVAEGWWEPYRRSDPHMLFSLTKSFTSTAIGLLVAEGRLSVEDCVLDHFPEAAPSAPSPHLRALRVRHLLTMTTGHTEDSLERMAERPEAEWPAVFLAQPGVHAPGQHFLYQNGPVQILSTLITRLTGQRLVDYLAPRLFTPLGIVDLRCETTPAGVDLGGWGMSATTDAIAAFGQLYLEKGCWQGVRVLPEAWVAAATARQVSNGTAPNSDWEQGYGYYFWRCRHGAYRGDGAFGQYCLVLPEQDAVLAMTGGLGDMQPPLDLVWQHLLPAMQPTPLPPDPAAQAALADQAARLRLRPPAGTADSPTAARVSGQTYTLAANSERVRALRFDFSGASAQITFQADPAERTVRVGYHDWPRGTTLLAPLEQSAPYQTLRPSGPWRVAAAGAWSDPTTYTCKVWWYETPFANTLTAHFAGDEVIVEQRANVGFGPTEGPLWQGQLS